MSRMHTSLQEITVGPQEADIIGTDSRAIQIAVDALGIRGGGTVRLRAGEYTLTGPVRLKSNVRLVGKGADRTILKRIPAVSSRLAKDADIGQKEITPVDASLFKPGMGVICRSNTRRDVMSTMPWTITEIKDGVLYLNDYITHDFIAERGGLVANVFPLVHGSEIKDAALESLTLDGQVNDDPGWAGIWGGNMYLRRCENCRIANIKSVNARGDGIRYGQSWYIRVEDCESAHNTHYGIHPGSHSKRTKVLNCNIHHNGSDGLYVCWGVDNSLFKGNQIHHNGFRIHRNGFCIGHKDTDNIIEGNHIYENAKHGMHFRKKTEANGAHRNTVRDNLIENNGTPKSRIPKKYTQNVPPYELMGCGIFICGTTHDLLFENNTVRETRKGKERFQLNGFYIEPGVTRLRMRGNKVTGHPTGAMVDKAKDKSNKLQKFK